MHKRIGAPIAIVSRASLPWCSRGRLGCAGAKPEDVFKGKIIITKNRLPMRFSSPGAFISALQKNKTDKIWPTEEKGDDKAPGTSSTSAFFAQPLNDSEIQVKFYDITGGDKKYVAGDPQYTRERGLAHLRLEHPAGQARVRRAQALHDDDRDRGAA